MQLNFKSFGQGEPLIILHGLFGSLDNWQLLAKRFAEEFWVITIDLRNHGRSSHSQDFNYALTSQDLANFMEAQFIPRAHILGHSMGGKAAMHFAIEHPDKVDRLMVLDISPKQYQAGHTEIFEAMFAIPMETVRTRKEIDTILKGKIESVGVRQFLMKNIARKKAGGFQWKMNLDSLHQNYPHIISAIEGEYDEPSLFIRGGNSNYISDLDWENIQEQFTDAQLKTVEQAGHWVHAEQPQALFEIVVAYLKS